MNKLNPEQKRLRTILYGSGLVFVILAVYEFVFIWNLQIPVFNNQGFVKGVVLCGLAIMFFYMPYSFSKCSDCSKKQKVGDVA